MCATLRSPALRASKARWSTCASSSRKGQEKDERAKQIEAEYIAKLEKNLGDEIRILTDERLKRLEGILGGKEVLADLHDERTNKRLLTKGAHSRPRHHRAHLDQESEADSL